MAKYPKFLECINPNSDNEDEVYIVHTQHPRFIAELFITNDENEMMKFEKHFNVGGRTNHKNYTASIGVVEFWDTPMNADKSSQELADDLAKLMRRCGDWYFNALKEIAENDE